MLSFSPGFPQLDRSICKDLDFPDPFQLPKDCWTQNPLKVPSLNLMSIYKYFVQDIKLYTTDFSKTYKSSQGFNFFISNNVQQLEFFFQNDLVAILADVLPSQRLAKKHLYKTYLICDGDGDIKTAYCSCMAG